MRHVFHVTKIAIDRNHCDAVCAARVYVTLVNEPGTIRASGNVLITAPRKQVLAMNPTEVQRWEKTAADAAIRDARQIMENHPPQPPKGGGWNRSTMRTENGMVTTNLEFRPIGLEASQE